MSEVRLKKIKELEAELDRLKTEEKEEKKSVEVVVDLTGDGKATIIKKEVVDLFIPIVGGDRVYILEYESDREVYIKKESQDEYYLVKRYYGYPPPEPVKMSVDGVINCIKKNIKKRSNQYCLE